MREQQEREWPADGGHAELLRGLELLAGHPPVEPVRIDAGDSYTSGGHAFYRISVPERRELAKRWLSEHRQSSAPEVLATASSLIAGRSFEEKSLGCMLLQYRGDVRSSVGPDDVERWLEVLVGWAEVDSLCQSVFTAEDLLTDWAGWRALLSRLGNSGSPNKRRASLVILTGPVRKSADPRLLEAAFSTIDRAKSERDVPVSKAVSWLLRSLAAHHGAAVAAYLSANERVLAPFVIRETRVKLQTGTKRGRRP